ncbi:GNAT family N-acetyltransferase [Limosilactobacillus sp.]|jgi:ribosomal protein S18 acetylase RimI-like enzyme|uniref:GNAT family N-acetyltransferase n=1 Tax=Limosilactobacillus sp. TaxID=2773925 RepID=UPI00344DC453
MELKITHATMEDLPAIVRIERLGFTAEEAGSEASFRERIEKIADTFLVAKIDQQLVGFVVGPAVANEFVTDEMYERTPNNLPIGGHQLILSIATDPAYRGHGIGSRLLDALTTLSQAHQREDISLDTLTKNIPFYEANGFHTVGVSSSRHAGETWYNMVKPIAGRRKD